LNLAVAANTTYTFSYYVLFQSANVNCGIGLALTGPAGGTISYTAAVPVALDGTGAMYFGWGTAYDDTVLGTGVQATGTTYVAHVYGVIANGATAGNLTLRYRSETGPSVTVKANSWGALEVG
jgi:hypothetical protein